MLVVGSNGGEPVVLGRRFGHPSIDSLAYRSGTIMLIRVDAGLNTSTDAATAAADQLAPGEYRTYALATSDKVAARMAKAGVSGALTLRTP